MKKESLFLNLNKVLVDNYQTRTESIKGIDHLVVPVIMMVEGVHSGNNGPILYTAEELSSFVNAWNGQPVVINHPEDENGNPVSANSPGIVESYSVGTIYNARMDGVRLTAEAFINLSNIKDISAQAIQMILDQRPMSVSIGVFTELDEVEGDWNGEHYIGVARNYRPDHLALLPESEGACSWDDGCGIRVNQRNSLLTKNNMTHEKKVKLEEYGVLLTLEGKTVSLFDNSELLENEAGYREVSQAIQSKLDSFDSPVIVNYLEEVFDSYFIYRVVNRENGQGELYKRNYQMLDNGTLQIEEGVAKVTKKVTYEVIQNNGLIRTKINNSITKQKGGTQMNGEVKASPCKVNALIANEATKFTEADREWLNTLEDSVLDKMTPKEVAPKTVEVPVTEAQIVAVLNSEKDPNAFIDKYMPEGMRESVKSGIRLNQEKRDNLIKGIVANSKFVEDNLKGWSTEDLEKLSESVVKETVNYGGPIFNTKSTGKSEVTDDMKIMLNLKTEEKK